MSAPVLSAHFRSRKPSAIRLAQIEFMKRTDGVEAINTAIGNVSLPMHPAMVRRMTALDAPESPFHEGVVKYSATIGLEDARRAFLNVIASSGCDTEGLQAQITDGASQAMELLVLGACGAAGSPERPLLLIDPAYTNYLAMADRLGRRTVSVQRRLGSDGRFSLPDLERIEACIRREKPGGLVVIPYDNPTGQFYDRETMLVLARLAVEHGMWLASDEAYRELGYVEAPTTSIWSIGDDEVPGLRGRRISLETASKVWNACGLRVGALVTDNREFHERSVAEYTANLCSNVIGQYIFGALAGESHADLRQWYGRLNGYYRAMMTAFAEAMPRELPGVVVSSPDASLYSVVDVREVVAPGYDAEAFVTWCAREGAVEMDGRAMTLLVAPMAEFYSIESGDDHPGRTQMRIAYVVPPEDMARVPRLFAQLLRRYESER